MKTTIGQLVKEMRSQSVPQPAGKIIADAYEMDLFNMTESEMLHLLAVMLDRINSLEDTSRRMED